MNEALAKAADAALDRAVARDVDGPGVPGVVAMATDRHGTIYAGACGPDFTAPSDPGPHGTAMGVDTVLALYSATKPVVGTACLQLVERGRLDLDAPARAYLPEIGEVPVLDGFAPDGTPRLRPPRRDITTRMLLLHTAGFGYDFFNAEYRRLVTEHGYVGVGAATRDSLRFPLLFDPGERWAYGMSIDWAGRVVEAIEGRALGDVLASEIFEPLGMVSTSFALDADQLGRIAGFYRRKDGRLQPARTPPLPAEPEIHMGGHGLFSTAADYIRFVRAWLNDGQGDRGRILRPETVARASIDGLGGRKVHKLISVAPRLTRDAEMFEGQPKSWGLTFMINDEPASTGRAAGTLSWAGLSNVFFWVDRRSNVGGFWATQLLPFMEPDAWAGFTAFESAVYDHR